jgi:hypothetical protein
MCTKWKATLYVLTADTLPAECSDLKHTKLELAVQETQGFKWEAFTIYIHSGEIAYNSQYTTQHDHCLCILVKPCNSEGLHLSLPATLSPTLSLPTQCSDLKHNFFFFFAVQEAYVYIWKGYIIFIHSWDTVCNSFYTASVRPSSLSLCQCSLVILVIL